jgi:hypothetical protein
LSGWIIVVGPNSFGQQLAETKENPFSPREKARKRGDIRQRLLFDPLSPTLSRRERGLKG